MWDKIIRVWDARTRVDQDGLEEHSARWNACRARMSNRDGWVKDGDRLLLWIPLQHRENIRDGIKLTISNKVRRARTPEVDAERSETRAACR